MKTMEILSVKFTQSLPTVTGMYLVLEKTPPPLVDEFFCNPFLCRINVDAQGNDWVQYSMEWTHLKMAPRDWHPIRPDCGWWFSRRIMNFEFDGNETVTDGNAQ